MKIYFINGNSNNESYSQYFKQYMTGGFYWLQIKDKIIYKIVIIKQKTLFYTCRIFLHEFLHFINLIINKNENNIFNSLIEKYI